MCIDFISISVIKLQILNRKNCTQFYCTHISHRESENFAILLNNESHPQASTVTADDWMMKLCMLAYVILYIVKSRNSRFCRFRAMAYIRVVKLQKNCFRHGVFTRSVCLFNSSNLVQMWQYEENGILIPKAGEEGVRVHDARYCNIADESGHKMLRLSAAVRVRSSCRLHLSQCLPLHTPRRRSAMSPVAAREASCKDLPAPSTQSIDGWKSNLERTQRSVKAIS